MKSLAAAIRNGSFKVYPTPEQPIPWPILAAAGTLAAMTVLMIAGGRVTGVGLSDTPDVATVAHRDLRLSEETQSGAVAVIDAETRQALVSLAPGEGGFAVEALRNLERDRIRKGTSGEAPFVLALKADGRLVVEDPETSQQVELRAFGEKQARAFAALMPAPVSQVGGDVE